MIVRWATEEEFSWVNQEYSSIDFLPSTWGKDKVAVAVVEGEKAGIGRLIPLKDNGYELSGIYVLNSFRNCGLAKKIVSFLLAHVPSSPLYCLPYEELHTFYSSFGFTICSQLPIEVEKKHLWCLEKYSKNVLAMERIVDCKKSSP